MVRRDGPSLALVVLVAVSCAWSVLLLEAPLAARGGRATSWESAAAAGAYLVGSLVCHQRPERSFHLAGNQMPVCARCAGLYWAGTAGLLMAAAIGVSAGTGRAATWRRAVSAGARSWLLLSSVPTAVTVVLGWASIGAPSNLARALAAVPLGVVAGLLVGHTLSFRGRL